MKQVLTKSLNLELSHAEKLHSYSPQVLYWYISMNFLDFPSCKIETSLTIGDGICDDENNNNYCFFDFGDCCRRIVNDSVCSDCECKQFANNTYQEKFENINKVLSSAQLKMRMTVISMYFLRQYTQVQ